MKFPRPSTKRMDKSHLTDKEKRHSIALVALGMLLLTSSIGGDIITKTSFSIEQGSIFAISAIGLAIIMFVWGYMGAMEDERSNEATK